LQWHFCVNFQDTDDGCDNVDGNDVDDDAEDVSDSRAERATGAMSCGQRRLALELHTESIEAEQHINAEDTVAAGADINLIPPAITPPTLPHSPGKLNRHASFFPSSSNAM
jgi:hypothetical protein